SSISALSPSSPLAKRLFDIDPDWVWMTFDNKGLHFWEGGCTWVKRDHITLQLNKAFQKKPSYFGYSREEVIAHELVHVARSNFEEPIFEEILAYQTSSSSFRRFCAPLFRTAKESLFFMITLAAFFAAAFFDIFQKTVIAGVLCLVTGGSLRLFWAQRTFSRTQKKLSKIVKKEHVLAVMLRLTDREIIRFSKMCTDEITVYATKMTKIQLRWQQIHAAYFCR
ncbi:MAG TPA: hypothetical protein VIH61_01250, partial [Waddliaceae bacterium]